MRKTISLTNRDNSFDINNNAPPLERRKTMAAHGGGETSHVNVFEGG